MADDGAFDEFSTEYSATVAEHLKGRWPPDWIAAFEFDACMKADDEKEVFFGRDAATGDPVVLRATIGDAPDSADAEAELLRHLNHPGIPKVYRSCVELGSSFIAREFFPGDPLDRVVRHHTLSPAETTVVARQIAEILTYLHSQNPPVVHRDLKPANIIQCDDGTIALTDFGIARTVKDDADTDTRLLGTLGYAPPEQFGYAQSTPQTDIYALGVVMLFLLTGSTDRTDLATKVTDPHLRGIIAKCLEFDPRARFQSADEVLKRLKHDDKWKQKVVTGVGAPVLAVALFTGGWVANDLVTGPSAPSTGPSNTFSPSDVTSTPGNSDWPVIPAPAGVGSYADGGNYPGNITNGGFAVASESQVFVATETGIVVLNGDGSPAGHLAVTDVSSLSYFDGLLYFLSGDTIARMNPEASVPDELRTVLGGRVYVDSSHLYFEDGINGALTQANLIAQDTRVADDLSDVQYRLIGAGWEIVARGVDAELSAVDFASGRVYPLGVNAADATLWDGVLYYSQPDGTHRRDLASGDDSVLSSDTYRHMVATPTGLFGVSPSGTLAVVHVDGSTSTLVPHAVGSFCLAGGWIVYQDGGDSGPLRMMKTDGTADQSVPS
ncbi:MAG: protein kinase [Propionibacteriaceae bacterium]|nr:protein kinase [Propionibacteriaceae bacterium]